LNQDKIYKLLVFDDLMGPDISVLAIMTNNERYTFIYDPRRDVEVIYKMGEYAGNPDLASFTWNCVGVLVKKIQEESGKSRRPDPLQFIEPKLKSKLEEAIAYVEELDKLGINPITMEPV